MILQLFTTEMLKEYQNVSLPVFSELFYQRDISYNLISNSNFAVLNEKSVFPGSENIPCLGPKIWDTLPSELKELTNLNAFKKILKDGNQKIVLAGYISNTYQILVSFKMLQKLAFNFCVIFNAF